MAIPYDATTMPKMVKGSCTTGDCGFRVAILAKNAKIENIPISSVVGEQAGRQVFFPDCKNINDGFVFLKGTTDEVNKALQGLTYKPTGF